MATLWVLEFFVHIISRAAHDPVSTSIHLLNSFSETQAHIYLLATHQNKR